MGEKDTSVDPEITKIVEDVENTPPVKEFHRIPLIDVLRGLAVISMVCYHWMWDVVYIQNESYPWYTGPLGYVWQQSFCWTFVLLSGFCVCIGRHPIRRGLLIYGCGALITVATVFILPRYFVSGVDIWFGALTLIGSSMMITGLLNPVLKKINPVAGLIIAGALFVVFRNVNSGWLGFENFNFLQLPETLYANYVTAYFGFPPVGFNSRDYFSLLPWLFLFLVGYFLHALYDRAGGAKEYKKDVFFFSSVGRSSLFIYILHQPLTILILFAIYANR